MKIKVPVIKSGTRNLELRTAYLWLLPALSLLFLFAFLPLLNTFWMSLHHRVPIFGLNQFVGLDNYSHIFHNPRFWHSLGVTAYFTLVSVVCELILGFLVAHLLWKDFKGYAWVMGILLIPWILPTTVTAKMWEWIFAAPQGLLNFFLVQSGVLKSSRAWLSSPFWAMQMAILADVWKTTPFMALLLLVGLRTIPENLYRAARVDGANSFQMFWHVTLSELRPILLVAVLFRGLDAFRVFDVVYVLTGGGPANSTESLSIYTYKIFFQTLQFGVGAALGVLMFLSTGLLSLIVLWFMRERRLV
ncbi:MAG: sugar ABC transporter permease [Elusimicrobia bacterium]|nr:sugar ABC transporter permease [Elusimicrobiota bacterium]